MKSMHITRMGISALLGLMIFSFAACQKEITASAELEAVTTEEVTLNQSTSETEFDDVFNITMGMGNETGEDLGIVGGISIFGNSVAYTLIEQVDSAVNNRCFTVTVTPRDRGVFPKTVTLDFGTGCRARDGRLRQGKIITVFTGPMGIPRSKATTTFDRYKVDSINVAGTHIVTNTSTSNNRIFSISVVDGKLTWDGGRWVRWSCARNLTQIEGNGTPMLPADDIFTITGGGRGENSSGKSWAHQIKEPLVKRFTCRWISKGILLIRRDAGSGQLDFGDGSCDNKAVLTINGVSKEITLR